MKVTMHYFVFFLFVRLDEAAERYKMRESRTEDLEMIQALRESVFEKEEHIRKLEVINFKQYTIFSHTERSECT